MDRPFPVVVGRRDPALGARVVSRRALLYDAGPDPSVDRPAHVRSGSALAWSGSRLAVVQDDAAFLALVDPRGGSVDWVELPAGPDGRRQFDDLRGNKALKLDLEACVALDDEGCRTIVAFGSGSTPARDRIVLLEEPGRVQVVDASALYAALRACEEFSGSELNVEGAVAIGDSVLLVQRGNGAPRAGRRPVDATCELARGELVRYLRDPRWPPPRPRAVAQYELGRVGLARLTFTDAALVGEMIFFLAAAECSPDATRDGPVEAVAIGVIEPGQSARWELLRAEDGTVLTDKVEGLAPDPTDARRLWAVVDRDEPGAPAELLALQLDRPQT